MLISLNNLTFGYDDVTVLEDVDVTVNENDRIGLVGVNGSGKSTLIKLMLGFLHADWGEVLKKSELSVGYLPQNAVLDSELTVESEAYSVFSEVDAVSDSSALVPSEEVSADSETSSSLVSIKSSTVTSNLLIADDATT